jgi:general secretion pathway protein G
MLRKKGFTLIELLIVIAVMSILIGIALPRLRGMREEGLIAQAKGEMRTLQTAIESYNIHNNAYPPSATFPAEIETASPNIVGTDAPQDPFNTGNDYGYALSTNGNYYVIYSVGIGGAGSAAVSDAGVITETNGDDCIYASNSGRDTTP